MSEKHWTSEIYIGRIGVVGDRMEEIAIWEKIAQGKAECYLCKFFPKSHSHP